MGLACIKGLFRREPNDLNGEKLEKPVKVRFDVHCRRFLVRKLIWGYDVL